MSAPLVFIETPGGQPTAGSIGLLAKARDLAGSAAAVVCGPGAAAVAVTLGAYGADETWINEDPLFDERLGSPRVEACAALVREQGYRTILFENSVLAAEVVAGLAAHLEAGVNWDLQDLRERDGELVGSRLALDDSVAVEVGWVGDVRLAVFRIGACEPLEHPVAGEVRTLEAVTPGAAPAARVVERTAAGSADEARLAAADIIVAGGRGVRDRESLGLLEDLARALGGAVAVTMPLVDRGWYPHSRQVGQTGQRVRPRLYLACGISGALGHRVGMEKSETILAVNSDPAAPIFGICDGGVVGDLHTIVPELTRLVRDARRSGRTSPGTV